MVRERPRSLASSLPGRLAATLGAALSVDVQGSAPGGSTHSTSVFERTASARSALRR